MEIYFFRLINNFADAHSFLGRIGIYTTRYLIYLLAVLAIVFAIIIFREKKERRVAVSKVFLSACFTYFINFLISVFYFRPRPFAVLENVHELIKKSSLEKSFPSDHTGVAFAIAFAVFLINKKWGSVFLTLAFLIGFSRIFVGVHYPLDILAGIFTGFLGAVFARYIINYFKK